MLRTENAHWHWQHDDESIYLSPADAIIASLATTVRRIVAAHYGEDVQRRHLPDEIVLTIPNDLPERGQRALLEAASRQGLRVRLIWRPVAAAMTWCDRYAKTVLREQRTALKGLATDGTNITVGRLLVLHLGLESVAGTFLALVAHRRRRRWYLLPGRNRPIPGHAANNVLLPVWEKALALAQTVDGANHTERWRLQWASSFMPYSIAKLRQANTSGLEDQAWRAAWHDAWFSAHAAQPSLFPWLPSEFERKGELPSDQLLSILHALQKSGRDEDLPILGVVITGPFAAVHLKSGTLADYCLRTMTLDCSGPHLVEGSNAVSATPLGLLADGAGSFGQKRIRDEPTYLDTLPRIDMAMLRRGEPAWLPLLQETDQWVEGGKVWRRDPNIAGLSIARESSSFNIALKHEEYETVRKVNATLDESLPAPVAVELAVQIEPAQGGAQVQVVPEKPDALGGKPVWVNWQRMIDTDQEPDAYLAGMERILPPLHRRMASGDRWRATSWLIEKVIMQAAARISTPQLAKLGDLLRSKDSNFYDRKTGCRDATAIDCEGMPAGGLFNAHLRDLVEKLVARLPRPAETNLSELDTQVVRVLGYTSTDHPAFLGYLEQAIRRQGTQMPREVIASCGWCLREPQMIAQFAELLATMFGRDGNLKNDWMKAFSEMLRFRDNATECLQPEHAAFLCEGFCDIFQKERQGGKAAFRFRNSCLTIVYLLRLRAYHNDFLDPESALARRIKKEFMLSIEAIRDGSLPHIGGAIQLDAALTRLVEYIDRRGRGIIDTGA